MDSRKHRRLRRGAPLALALCWSGAAAFDLGDLTDRLPDDLGLEDSVGRLVEQFQGERARPVHADLADAYPDLPLLDRWDPVRPVRLGPADLGRDGTFTLRPGFYELEAESYCIRIGTHSRGGNGYLAAPLKGENAGLVRSILRRSALHPELSQHRVQRLIWAIGARARYDDLDPADQAAARTLLTDAELFQLRGGVAEVIPDSLRSRVLEEVSPSLRPIVEAEMEMREVFSRSGYTYEDLERIAVRSGLAPTRPDDIPVAEGRWSLHPDGYLIRYKPRGFSETKIQIFVPGGVRIERDGRGRITAVRFPDGYTIETEYDDGIPPLRVPADSRVVGYAFKRIRITRPGEGTGAETLVVRDRGWTFVSDRDGRLADFRQWPPRLAQARNGPLHLAVDIPATRFKWWRERYNEVKERIDSYTEHYDRATDEETREDVERLGDHEHYREGIDAALRGSPADRMEWTIENRERQNRALGYNVERLDELPTGPGSVDPSDTSAVPGSTAGQSLGLTARPSSR